MRRPIVRAAVRTPEDPARMPWRERHDKRLADALAMLAQAREGVGKLGLWLRVAHRHWIVTYTERGPVADDAAVEWWPHSGRCRLRGERELKVYDVPGFLKVCRLAANMGPRSTPAPLLDKRQPA